MNAPITTSSTVSIIVATQLEEPRRSSDSPVIRAIIATAVHFTGSSPISWCK
jgi:hypothetical protein